MRHAIPYTLGMVLLYLLITIQQANSQTLQASLYTQQASNTITLHMEEARIMDVFQEIEKLSGYVFIYSHTSVNADKLVSVAAKNQSLDQVLRSLLKPFKLEYTILGNQIILKSKKSSDKLGLLPTATQTYKDQIITGIVTDAETNEALPSVNVLIKGTTIGTVTDVDGKYSLKAPDNAATLVVSYIGYLAQEMAINGRNEINVALAPDVKSLEEVIVVGYGTQSTRQISGAVQNITSKELKDAPVAQVGQLLQGKLSGVRILQTSGRPGEGLNIQIRGAVSITAGAEPLYVVDGMPITGNISNLNPSEIESISVLKDAAATSLYGSRAANGVVLITTKTATPGRTQVDFSSFFGFERIPQSRRLHMMNATQYAQFEKEISDANGRPVNPMFQNPEQYNGQGTDWFDEITQTGTIQSYNLSVNTGTKNFSTSVTGGYFNQEGVVKGTGYERLSLRMNSRFQPHPKVNIGFNVAPSYTVNTNGNTDGNPYGGINIVSSALITTPLVGPYNPDGTLALTATDPASFGNPNWVRVAKERVYKDKDQILLSNAFVEYEVIKGLKAKTTANIQLGNSNVFQFNPSTIGGLFSPPPRIPSGSENNYRYYNWLNENSLTYQTNLGDHNIEALAGFTAQRFRGDGSTITATNYPDDKIQAVSAAGRVVVTNDVQEWSLLSYLARINYNYKGRYLLTASIRRDGSSRFGPKNRWGNFPSASLGWIVSEESFWNVAPVSFLKIRASYGITGNFEIGNYTFRSTLSPAYYAFGNSLFQGKGTNNLGDEALGWEKKRQFNIGADVHLLKDRIQLTYNYYQTNTSDLLFNVAVPKSSGFSNMQTNIGELKFWGHEIAINTVNIQKDNLTWNTSFNISFDRNRTLSLATKETPLFHGLQNYGFYSHRTQVGQPIGMFYGAVQEGVYVNQQDFDASPKHESSQVGTIKFRDLNGDGVITFPQDYTTIGNPWPKFTFGMSNTLNYRNFDASVIIAGSYGNEILAHHENWTTNLDGVFNVLEEVKDRWKSPEEPGAGKYGSVQQGTTFLERDRWHSRFVKDGSFLSFKNITLGYTLPLKENGMIRALRVYGSVQNAFILTNYPGPNPEVNTRSSGSGSTPGVDENSYPLPRTLSLGVNVSF